jgi:CheY-like chemotaxis protein
MKTLLLADDSVTIQRVIELTFADEDIKVIAVSDGDQAISRVSADLPDIVLADIGMPGRNGYEVAQYIKQTPSLAHIPVVLLTGAFEPVDHARATAAGCDGVLAKPFEPQLVISRVKELLARSPSLVASPGVGVPPPADLPIESWVPAPGGPAFAAHGSQPVESAEADYFDRLDEAFANLSTGPQGGSKHSPSPPTTSADWFATAPRSSALEVDDALSIGPLAFSDDPPDLPIAQAAAAKFNHSISLPAVPLSPTPADQSVPTISAQTMPARAPNACPPAPPPPIAETFAALLAAELNEPGHAVAPVWPTVAASEPVDTSAVVEQVVERVLAHLSDRVVRETVAEIVSKVAERLVQEEIDRIKASTG